VTQDTATHRADFTAALQAGDEAAARAVVERMRDGGLPPDTIYLTVFAPSMVTIGELWERNELSVAEEHLATAITERLISELSPWFSRPEQQPEHGSVILGCVEGERHSLGLRMLADMFRQRGWRVLYLGADVPTADWVELAARYQADVVAISAGAQRYIPAIRSLVARLRAVLPDMAILVGGAAFDRAPDLWREVGATFYHPDPTTAVAAITGRARKGS
jgi:methanogenic corrinoid protein MtbC1